MLERNNLRKELELEVAELQRLKKDLQEFIDQAPQGSVNILQKPGKEPYCYWYQGRKKRIYLKKSETELAKQLAQKEYDEKVLKLIDKRLPAAMQLLEGYNDSIDQVIIGMNPVKQKMVQTVYESDEEYIRDWYEKHPGGQNTYAFHNEFYSNRGEQMRSKSEKIIADLLERYGIPYVYEPLIRLKNGQFICPDFLILNVRLRKTIIYEHFGMMSDGSYSERVCEKMNEYEKNNYRYGENFFFSMESQKDPLNTKCIERMIHTYFK